MLPRIEFDSVNSFNKNIDFEIEVADDDEVRYRGRGREAVGGDGKATQFTLQYVEETIDLRFNWMSEDIKEQVAFWMLNYGVQGDEFRYYPDQTDLTRYYVCKLNGNNKDFNPRRAHPRVEEYDVRFSNVRIIDISAQIATDRAAWYP